MSDGSTYGGGQVYGGVGGFDVGGGIGFLELLDEVRDNDEVGNIHCGST